MRPGWEKRPDPHRRACRVDPADPPGPSAAVVRLSEYIRRLYIEDRSLYESMMTGTEVVYIVPQRYDGAPALAPEEQGSESVWLKLAQWMLDNAIDPDLFIHDVMEFSVNTRPPEPPHLMTPRRLEEYHQVEARMDLAGALRFQVELCSRQITLAIRLMNMDKEAAYAWVLTKEDLELSALFRYCVARSIAGDRFVTIARRYDADAAVQFCRQCASYLQHWASVLPDGYQEHADRVYRRLGGAGRRT